ncbi:MAG: hypothetical protein VX447_07490 [Pseudomonadota bacterium]|uniref:Nmad2 family putative nucleotide modification protein n=1 Tax=Gallaecimonas pentaromativorans TaxID=584787 RepID=UPI000B161A37|nr:hypothetical protein [Gallaecimonas pentaromativorans]MED5524576.1 hypothetical protein [Pseudomonadota bacterium]
MKIFTYKIVRDYGFAPNPFHGVLTLATCKPKIRSGAKIGDLIFGCGSKSNGMIDKIIYVMEVNEKISFDEYWSDAQYESKKPCLYSSKSWWYGDNIYHRNNDGVWIQEDSHHSFERGLINERNVKTDTSSNNVLVSRNFIYWGKNAILMPDFLSNFKGESLYPNTRDYRSSFSKELVVRANQWFESIPFRGFKGKPIDWDR